jgi:hypothetical protein
VLLCSAACSLRLDDEKGEFVLDLGDRLPLDELLPIGLKGGDSVDRAELFLARGKAVAMVDMMHDATVDADRLGV